MRYVRFLFVVVTFALSACGGGGGGDASVADERPSGNISGVAFDGLIIGGTVEVFDFTDGRKGAKLGGGITDGSGLYSISLSTSDKPILVEISGGYYIEEATGKQIQVDKTRGHKLLAVEYYESGSPIEISATFFSTIATGYAEYLIAEGMSAGAAIEKAYQQVDSWSGFNTRKTVPLAVNDSQNVTPFITDAHRYGFVAAGVSELTRVLGYESGNGEHNDFSSIAFILSAYSDIKADGVLDGRSATGAINFAGYPVNSNTYRDLIALRMLQFVQGPRNATTLDFDEVLPFASQINLFADELFNYQEAPDISEAEPTVSQFLPAEGEVISGGYQASAVVSDDYGLSSVEYYVDGKFVASAGNPYDPIRNIDTLNFTNGLHRMTVVVTNVMGNTASLTHEIFVNNGTISFSVVSSKTDFVTANGKEYCPAKIRINDGVGLGVAYVKVNGVVRIYEDDLVSGSAVLTTNHEVPVFGNPSTCPLQTVEVMDRLGNVYTTKYGLWYIISGDYCYVDLNKCRF